MISMVAEGATSWALQESVPVSRAVVVVVVVVVEAVMVGGGGAGRDLFFFLGMCGGAGGMGFSA
jgi:hypothetical protein